MSKIKKFDSLEEAWGYIHEEEVEDYVDGRFAVNLTNPDSRDFWNAAEKIEDRCCGVYQGVFEVDGELWYLGCDYGH